MNTLFDLTAYERTYPVPDYSVATCSYTAFRPEMGVPVSTSTGYPRFAKIKPVAKIVEAAPVGIFGDPACEDPEVFKSRYLARLDENADAILAALADIAAAHDGPPVLLCFENLSTPGKWCHRTLLGEWLADRLGGKVPELGPTG